MRLKFQPYKIKVCCLDCDGVLSDGCYHQTSDNILFKSFYTRDLWAIEELLIKNGIHVKILTYSSDLCVVHRFRRMKERNPDKLSVDIGVSDKKEHLYKQLKEWGIDWRNVAYMGDAEPDLECIKVVGWSACPADAIQEIKENVDLICEAKGGRGAVYEFAQEILLLHKWIKEIK